MLHPPYLAGMNKFLFFTLLELDVLHDLSELFPEDRAAILREQLRCLRTMSNNRHHLSRMKRQQQLSSIVQRYRERRE